MADLPALVRPGDLLVVNDTRVIPARLRLAKPTGGAVEVLLARAHGGPRVDGAGAARPPGAAGHRARSRRRRGRSWSATRSGDGERLGAVAGRRGPAGRWCTGWVAAAAAVHHHGPRRPRAVPDRVRPTARARRRRPTAGLHLTPKVLDRCVAAGAQRGRGRARGRASAPSPRSGPSEVEDHTDAHASATSSRRRRVHAVGRAAAGDRRRHDRRAGARVLGGDRARPRARTDLFIRRGHQFARRRRPAHQLPRAPLDPAGAGRRVRRRPLAGPLRRRRSTGATASCPSATPCSCERRVRRPRIAVEATDGSGPGRAVDHRPGHLPHAVLHAGRHPGRGAAPVVGRPGATSASR